MSRRAARIDENQPGIVDALRSAGAYVFVCSDIGRGYPDLTIVHPNCGLQLVEIKNPEKPVADQRLKPDQIEFHAQCLGHGYQVHVVKSIDEALALVGAR